MPKTALDRKRHRVIYHHLQANTRISLICYIDSLTNPILKRIIRKRCQVCTKPLKRWTLTDYDTGARNPASLRALSPSNTQKGKCKHQKPKENSLYVAEIRTKRHFLLHCFKYNDSKRCIFKILQITKPPL